MSKLVGEVINLGDITEEKTEDIIEKVEESVSNREKLIAEDYLKGDPIKDIVTRHEVSTATVYEIISRLDLPLRGYHNNGRPKKYEEQEEVEVEVEVENENVTEPVEDDNEEDSEPVKSTDAKETKGATQKVVITYEDGTTVSFEVSTVNRDNSKISSITFEN